MPRRRHDAVERAGQGCRKLYAFSCGLLVALGDARALFVLLKRILQAVSVGVMNPYKRALTCS